MSTIGLFEGLIINYCFYLGTNTKLIYQRLKKIYQELKINCCFIKKLIKKYQKINIKFIKLVGTENIF